MSGALFVIGTGGEHGGQHVMARTLGAELNAQPLGHDAWEY